ncbi:hypothetical protein HIM_05858 [Hirsutella minnesotensis 3608]|uniref:Uncharacterized protein n=1 Tax=Hirsutella minnesotensis 3608 TaxID=1043627 RepID=A0A0F7ZJW5_9HYPO|nr:hypothetical protein HIM_05858 [Hirsutella minnesotensis 3608]
MAIAQPPAGPLSPEQVRSLFNILTHYGLYSEIEVLKEPLAWPRFGFPFADRAPGSVAALEGSLSQLGLGDAGKTKTKAGEASVPVLQMLLVQFVLPLPGLRDYPADWWRVRALNIVARLAQADLSESYDKGVMGSRKTLMTASSSVLEMVARGSLGGLPRAPTLPEPRQYDRSRAQDLQASWDDLLQNVIYGDIVDKFFDYFEQTEDLDSFMPGVGAVTDYIVIHLAGLVHQIFIRSSEGPYLLKLIENVHGLIPWKLVKQTLRVGNAATMINGMLRLILAKLSVTSVTNWVGLTKNADDGMNLLQKIISLVLSWDASDFRKGADQVEKAKDRPDDFVLRIIREHVALGREDHEAARAASVRKGQSIINIIVTAVDPALAAALTEQQHAQCLEYYAALLAIRDREAISASLCRETPDHLTQAVREGFAAYTPMIRLVHERIDLKTHMDALQNFIDDFIQTGKPDRKTGAVPSVDDYVALLHKHRGFLYRFLHHIASKTPEVWSWYRDWAKASAVITPATAHGHVRSGREVKNAPAPGKTGAAADKKAATQAYTGMPDTQLPQAPDVSVVLRALGDDFGRVVRERAIALQAEVDLS